MELSFWASGQSCLPFPPAGLRSGWTGSSDPGGHSGDTGFFNLRLHALPAPPCPVPLHQGFGGWAVQLLAAFVQEITSGPLLLVFKSIPDRMGGWEI